MAEIKYKNEEKCSEIVNNNNSNRECFLCKNKLGLIGDEKEPLFQAEFQVLDPYGNNNNNNSEEEEEKGTRPKVLNEDPSALSEERKGRLLQNVNILSQIFSLQLLTAVKYKISVENFEFIYFTCDDCQSVLNNLNSTFLNIKQLNQQLDKLKSQIIPFLINGNDSNSNNQSQFDTGHKLETELKIDKKEEKIEEDENEKSSSVIKIDIDEELFSVSAEPDDDADTNINDEFITAYTFDEREIALNNNSESETCSEFEISDGEIDLPQLKSGQQTLKVKKRKRRLRAEEKRGVFKCPDCPKIFDLKSRLYDHKRYHGDAVFPCQFCGKLMNKALLKRHLQGVHGDRRLKCSICNYTCNLQFRLANHMKIHSEDKKKIFICDVCGKDYYYSSGLKKHMENSHKGSAN